MAEKTYVSAVSSSVLQGLFAAGWYAAGSLPPGERRVLRAGAAAMAGFAVVPILRQQKPAVEERGQEPAVKKAEPGMVVSRDPEVAARMEAEMRPIVRTEDWKPALRDAFGEVTAKCRRNPVLTSAALVYSLAMIVGSRRLERRWLAGLVRDGHPHPHRALAIRMGLLTMVGSLPSSLVDAREARSGH
jgi:hypothetical protein